MANIKLPLEPLVLSIGIGEEPGPGIAIGRNSLNLDFDRLTPETLHQIAPDHVTSWLFCARYDAYDVARHLTDARYSGTYHAVAPRLPKKSLVAREIKTCFPDLDFQLVSPAELSIRAARYFSFIANAKANRAPVLA